MDLKALDTAIREIAKRRMELQGVDYNNPKYDELEEQLHDLEDGFQDDYGDYLEEALQQIHDEYAPDTDVLLPVAYIAKNYKISEKDEYSVTTDEGVYVEIEKLPGRDAKLVILPNPIRVVLNLQDKQQVVWTAK